MDKYLNLYRLSLKPYGQGSRVAIDTQFEMVSSPMWRVKDSQCEWKHSINTAHIKNLFYTFIWNFCPQLIEDGYVYAGVPPLYKITIGKEYKYIKNDEALEEFRKNNSNRKYQVNRMKGLGEMSVDETEETLTDVDNRIIKQITVEDAKATSKLFEDLMGTGAAARKIYIKQHSKEATYNAE